MKGIHIKEAGEWRSLCCEWT